MARRIFPKITWIDDDDIIEVFNIMAELRLGYESNEKYLQNRKLVIERYKVGSCSRDDLKDLSEKEENIFIEYIRNFSKKNPNLSVFHNELHLELLNKYGRGKVSIAIHRSLECEIEARLVYNFNTHDSEPIILNVMSLRENLIIPNQILFSLSGQYSVIKNKEPIKEYFFTYNGEKIRPSFFQKLKMLVK